MFSATSPLKEMEETARRIARLIREKDCRYGEIAVITGNLEEYGNLATQVFAAAGIPYFIDLKHSVLMNPFVEYFRAALEMAVQDFSYESVFRYLRSGLADFTREEVDKLEYYCIRTGIRGRRAWTRQFTHKTAKMQENVDLLWEMDALRESSSNSISRSASFACYKSSSKCQGLPAVVLSRCIASF